VIQEILLNYRNRKLLDKIHEFPICTRCGRSNDGSVVPAHSNQLRDGKGKGIKSHDYRVAALCYTCHMELDQGKDLTKEERLNEWEEAHRVTMGLLFQLGMVDVSNRR